MTKEPTDGRRSIVDIVQDSAKLQGIIKQLKSKRFLLDGIFDPRACLIDEQRIEAAWKKEKSRINAIAVGVSRYNRLFYDVTSRRDMPSKETRIPLNKWMSEVKKKFPTEYEEIDETCGRIGQYLEWMNRKSQGF